MYIIYLSSISFSSFAFVKVLGMASGHHFGENSVQYYTVTSVLGKGPCSDISLGFTHGFCFPANGYM